MERNRYHALLIMTIIMIAVGYFAMTASLTKNKTINLNKIYGVLLMAVAGSATMIMISHRPLKGTDLLISGILLAVVFWLVLAMRRQSFVGREHFLKGMVEHHAMALVMARGILNKTRDPDLRQLADGIIANQSCEIDLMRRMLKSPATSDEITACKT